MNIASRIDVDITGNEAKEIIKVINNYSNALNLLDDYDHKRIVKPNGNKDNKEITYDDCMDVINKVTCSNHLIEVGASLLSNNKYYIQLNVQILFLIFFNKFLIKIYISNIVNII